MDISVVRKKALLFAQKPLTKRIAIGIGIFLLLYGLLGYFFLPGIIKARIEQEFTEKYHRPTTIERIDINPYALALNIHKLKALEPDGKRTFVSFDKLRVNISMWSLFRFAPVISELKLEKPYLYLARTSKNRYSIQDIRKAFEKQPKSEAPSPFAVYNILVEGGKIEFEDRPKNTNHVITELNIGIPFISSLASQVDVFVEPFLDANINGSNLKIKGKTLPFSETRETMVNLDFDDIDLTKYLEYLPFKPGFNVQNAKLALHITANFKQMQDHKRALEVTGSAALKEVHINELNGDPIIKLPELSIDLDSLNLISGRLNIAKIALINPELSIVRSKDGALNLERLIPSLPAHSKSAGKEKTDIKVALKDFEIKNGQLVFKDFRSTQPMSSKLEKLDLSIRGSKVDFLKQDIAITAISTDGAKLNIQHNKGSKKSIQNTKASNTKKAAESEWGVSIANVAVSNWSAEFEDQNLQRRRKTEVAPISITASDISTKHDQKGKLAIEAKVNEKGSLTASGSIGLAPMHAAIALDVKNVSLLPAQPFFTDQLNLTFTRANLTSNGALQLDENKQGALKGGFKGNVAFTQVATVDKVSAKDFVSWRNLAFQGINTKLNPFSLSIRRIMLDRYYARIIVSPEGRINLQDVIRGPGEPSKSLAKPTQRYMADKEDEDATPAPAPIIEQKKSEKSVPPIKIDKLTLRRGRVRFTDLFIKPNYTANIVDLGGTVTGLSSQADATATVDLSGKLNSVPLAINGSINPLKHDLFLDIKGEAKGIELAPLSTYSGKYAGYGIKKGKLSFDVAYMVDQRKLSAQNHLILDQLTFGEKVESPSATKLPIMLAVALLRDRNGVINIRLPVNGSLDDPQFSVGGIVIKAFFKLITKAVTSPFALLGSIFGGGGEELSWLNFEPGIATISPNAELKLATLSKALIERPGLKLEIKGLAGPVADRAGLAKERMKRKMRLLKKKDMILDGTPIPPDGIVVSKKEYPDLLRRVYQDEDFERPRNFIGLLKALPVPEMEKLMLANANISDDDLLQLGTARAQAVKAWLIEKGVPAERIFIVASQLSSEKDKQESSRVDFSLK